MRMVGMGRLLVLGCSGVVVDLEMGVFLLKCR